MYMSPFAVNFPNHSLPRTPFAGTARECRMHELSRPTVVQLATNLPCHTLGSSGGFHKWWYPNSRMVYRGKIPI